MTLCHKCSIVVTIVPGYGHTILLLYSCFSLHLRLLSNTFVCLATLLTHHSTPSFSHPLLPSPSPTPSHTHTVTTPRLSPCPPTVTVTCYRTVPNQFCNMGPFQCSSVNFLLPDLSMFKQTKACTLHTTLPFLRRWGLERRLRQPSFFLSVISLPGHSL